MSNKKWINNGGIYYQIPSDFQTFSSPGLGIFKINYTRDRGFGLERVCNEFDLPSKIYNLGIDDFLKRIEDTWKTKYFKDSNKNLGVILSGTKGAGKTLSAKVLCNKLKLPVVLVSNPEDGLVEFIQSIDFECIIFIDEAEKIFNDSQSSEDSQMLLRMIDGSMNLKRKLYVLTTNTLNINENLIGRPGRIRYIKKFTNITQEAVDEYLKDNLINKDKEEEVKDLINLLEVSTIDTLHAIVDEVNIHGGLSNYEDMNLTLKSNVFSYLYVSLRGNSGVDMDKLISDLREFVKNQYTIGKKLMGVSFSSWLWSEFDLSLDPTFKKGRNNPYEVESDLDEPCEYYTFDRSDKLTVSRYLADKFSAYNDSVSLKLNRFAIGDYFQHFGGTVSKIFSDGWMIVSDKSGSSWLIYAEKEDRRSLL